MRKRSEPRASFHCLQPEFAILTCMDARLDPAKYAGLAEGDAQPVYGYVYDESGRLNEVKTATEAGKTKTAC